MKIGLDTNILVRYITDDIPEQADQVEKLFNSFNEETVFVINEVALAELDWVLAHVYNYSKDDFLKTINRLFETANITFESPLLVRKACDFYAGSSADFADCYLGVINASLDCKTTYTFDKKASKLSSFTLLN